MQASAFLSYAFRPFFLLSGLFAMLVMALWVLALHGVGPASLPANIIMWHGHEMMVGFAMAAIAGFLLTAVATWTDRPPLSGSRLGWLAAAWLSGRCVMLFAGALPLAVVALLDMLFPLLLVVFVAQEIIGGGSRRNYPIIGITVLLGSFNLFYHFGAFAGVADAQRIAVYLLISLVLLLITVIAGRIVPNFTANWMRARGEDNLPVNHVLTDRATILLTVLSGVAISVAPMSVATGAIALAAAFAHGARLSRWRGLATVQEPLLFALHIAYLWLPVGYALTALSVFSAVLPPTAALHALTMGAIGSMVLAVTTRVALAHTGRPLHAARLTVIAYLLFTLAVVVRVFSPLLAFDYLSMIDVSALGWSLSFAIFCWVYWPVLTQPRVD
jgi:uncharacterized protein involved in response to NO